MPKTKLTQKQLSRIRTWQQVSRIVTDISTAKTLVNFASTSGMAILNKGFDDFRAGKDLIEQHDRVAKIVKSLESKSFLCILHWCIVNIGNNLEQVLSAGAFVPSVVLSIALLYRKMCLSEEDPRIEASMILIIKSRQFRDGEYELLKELIQKVKCSSERLRLYAGVLLGFIYEAFAFACKNKPLSLVVRD